MAATGRGRRWRNVALAGLAVGTALLCAACWFPYDIDGDGRADLVYVNSVTDQWYRYGSPDVIRTGGGVPAMGNYDGQGSWELAEANRTTGMWTTAGGRGDFSFPAPPAVSAPQTLSGGVPAPMPVPARYDGNDTTEAAWYRPADAMWFIEGRPPIQFGSPVPASGPPEFDIPVPGDYNGDGVDELAVYHPSDSTFHIMGDPDPIPVGHVGDVPAPADFDGNGTTDPATFAVNYPDGSGTWHIAGQADVAYPSATAPFEDDATVIPAPANYDGQGGADPAVMTLDFDTHTSTWQISTIGDLQLGPANLYGGAEVGGPAMENDLLSILMVADTARYCRANPC
jgi:hypothetical protein